MPRTRRREGARPRERRLLPRNASTPRLSPERAFVVQLESRRQANRQALRGKVEHLSTGEARHFGSLAELVGFMSRFWGGAR
jgi:hypothetical protein